MKVAICLLLLVAVVWANSELSCSSFSTCPVCLVSCNWCSSDGGTTYACTDVTTGKICKDDCNLVPETQGVNQWVTGLQGNFVAHLSGIFDLLKGELRGNVMAAVAKNWAGFTFNHFYAKMGKDALANPDLAQVRMYQIGFATVGMVVYDSAECGWNPSKPASMIKLFNDFDTITKTSYNNGNVWKITMRTTDGLVELDFWYNVDKKNTFEQTWEQYNITVPHGKAKFAMKFDLTKFGGLITANMKFAPIMLLMTHSAEVGDVSTDVWQVDAGAGKFDFSGPTYYQKISDSSWFKGKVTAGKVSGAIGTVGNTTISFNGEDFSTYGAEAKHDYYAHFSFCPNTGTVDMTTVKTLIWDPSVEIDDTKAEAITGASYMLAPMISMLIALFILF